MHLLELWKILFAGMKRVVSWREVSLHLARSGSQSEHNIRRVPPARGACHIIISVKIHILDITVIFFFFPFLNTILKSLKSEIGNRDFILLQGN